MHIKWRNLGGCIEYHRLALSNPSPPTSSLTIGHIHPFPTVVHPHVWFHLGQGRGILARHERMLEQLSDRECCTDKPRIFLQQPSAGRLHLQPFVHILSVRSSWCSIHWVFCTSWTSRDLSKRYRSSRPLQATCIASLLEGTSFPREPSNRRQWASVRGLACWI